MKPQINADERRLVIKKYVTKKSFAFVIIAALILMLLGFRLIDGGGTVSSYSFLGGRNPVAFRGTKIGNRRYTYSFEADFNDVCSKADAELIPAGFAAGTATGNDFSGRHYWLENRFPRGSILIYIYNNSQYIELPDSKNGAFSEKNGWVRVEIVYFRGWRWPF